MNKKMIFTTVSTLAVSATISIYWITQIRKRSIHKNIPRTEEQFEPTGRAKIASLLGKGELELTDIPFEERIKNGVYYSKACQYGAFVSRELYDKCVQILRDDINMANIRYRSYCKIDEDLLNFISGDIFYNACKRNE